MEARTLRALCRLPFCPLARAGVPDESCSSSTPISSAPRACEGPRGIALVIEHEITANERRSYTARSHCELRVQIAIVDAATPL